MQIHIRTFIRKAIIQRLMRNTMAQERVYDSRLYNLQQNALPGIIVFCDYEEVSTETISFPRSQMRNLRLTVECYVKDHQHINSHIDKITHQVETLIMSDANLGGLVKDCRLESTENNYNNEADYPVAVASLIFKISYRTKENATDKLI
ncbi:MAG: hypothetical protein DGJ47_000541 [Rickettsiaceae bacterium]